MSWFSRCSWCGGPFNGGNCRRCTNVSFGDDFVRNTDPISNDETPNFSYPPPQPQTSLLDQFHCKDPLEKGERCQWCTCKWCGYKLREGFCLFCASRDENSSIDVPNPNSFNDLPDVFTHPPQPQYETYSCELCGNDSHHGYDSPARFPLIKDYHNEKIDIRFRRECESMIDELKGKFNGMSIEINKKKELQHLEQPEDSLSMRDERLSTIPEKESDKVIKSSVENLVPIPSKSKDLTDYESECDMPVCDDSSSKNDGLDDIVSIPSGKEIDHLDAIPDSVQSLLNRANSIIFLIEEFSGELAPINPIPPRIVKADLDPEEDIRLIEKLFNDDSPPHSLEELNSKITDAIIESFSPSPILVEDSDSLMEEIDIFLAPDDSIPPGIENDDYDSEGDVLFLKNYLTMILFPFLNDDVYFDIEPDTGVLTTKVVDDISDNSTRELYVHVPNVLPTLPTLYPVFDTLLPFSSENEDKVFNPGILISKEEKSPHLLSHRGFKVFQLINDSESPMMIYGGDIPILDVPYLHFYPP
ncbi:hypothetical protein Tco_0296542 [Tanacetum coccineum]